MNDFLNATVETMTPYLLKRTQTLFSNMQKRSREFNGESVPFTLNALRAQVVIPGLKEPRCVYCGQIRISETMFQVDHRKPLVRGGSWQLTNLVLCCIECNTIKGALTTEEYLALRDLVMGWNPYAAQDIFRRMKVGANPMAARLLAGKK